MSSVDVISRPHEASFLEVVNLMLRARVAITYSAFAGAFLFAAISLLITPTYVAHTAFIQSEPARTSLSGNLMNLASRFGVAPTSDPMASLDFLRQVLTSQDVLDSVLLRPLRVDRSRETSSQLNARDSVTTVDLASWYKINDAWAPKRLDRLRRRILRDLKVDTDQRSGIATVSMGMRDPYVAAAFLRALVEALDNFNRHTRQTISRENRVFLEARVDDARAQLSDAEGRFRQFYESNRVITGSPALIFEEGRLKRQVDLAQQIFVTLSQQLEQARIDEVKDTPVLTVVETATVPVRRSSPKRRLLAVVGLVLGATLGLVGDVAMRTLNAASQAGSPDWNEFADHLKSLRARIRGRTRAMPVR